MSVSKIFILFLTGFLLLIPQFSEAQTTRKQLEQRRKQKEKEIRLTKKILARTRNKKKKTLSQLNLLNRQIKMREELISTMADEINVINRQIESENANVENLGSELKRLKDEYADMIYRSYKMRESGDLSSYVLASDNFNQAVKRIKYVQQIGEDRERQVALIGKIRDSISSQLVELKKIKNQKSELLAEKEKEKRELSGDKQENQRLVKNLKKKETTLKNDLKYQKQSAKNLDNRIRKLIREEIARAKRNKKGKPAKKGEMRLTPEAAALAKEFGRNKGKLPWPVERGIIMRRFGTYAHPELPGITIVNNGVDIATVQSSIARSVMAGEVRSVFSIPGMQKAVMVKHGNYFTVYAHLDQVLVTRGDKIKALDDLGVIHTDDNEDKTILHFEIWKNNSNLNPQLWLAK